MSDPCKHCIAQGKIRECQLLDCDIHESWYALYLKEKIIELEGEEGKCKLCGGIGPHICGIGGSTAGPIYFPIYLGDETDCPPIDSDDK